jgi:hypothetical protein
MTGIFNFSFSSLDKQNVGYSAFQGFGQVKTWLLGHFLPLLQVASKMSIAQKALKVTKT